MLDSLKNGLRCIFCSRLRAALTVLGIAVGVMSVVLVSAIGEVGKSAINAEMSGMGMDNLVISASVLDENDLESVREMENVTDAMPLMNIVTSMSIKNESRSAMVWGVNEDADKVINLDIRHGRLLNSGDVAQRSRVCVIDEAIAFDSYKRCNIVGKKLTLMIRGNEVEFEIVGVVKNGVNTLQNMLGGFIPDFVYIPYTVISDYSTDTDFDNITVKIPDYADSDTVAAAIENQLGIEKDDAKAENLMRQRDKMSRIMDIASAALSVVAGISLIVSGISIMTVMLVSVNERTREIGIKKSIGATTGAIMSEFLLESVLITLTGGITGLAAGTGLAWVISMACGIKAGVSVGVGIGVLLVSVGIGALFGVYPAKKAAMLKPVEALKHQN